jgi:hypothetical protein
VPVPVRRILPETLVTAILVPASLVVAAGYLADTIGVPMHPLWMGMLWLVAAGTVLVRYRAESDVAPRENARDVVAVAAVTIVVFAYFLLLAAPSLLPITIAPDVVHHLILTHLIQRTQHLAHDPALTPYLLEMTGYTPGVHILSAAAAWWLRVDPLRLMHPVAALFTALNLGIVYLIALRLQSARGGAWLSALGAPVLSLVPAAYTFGAFLHFFFLSQVVSETFALAMLLAVIDWVRGTPRALMLFAACGVAVFLVWPVWLAPPVLALAMATLLIKRRAAFVAASVALAPIVLVAAVHVGTHPGAAGILTSSGTVTSPSIAVFGAAFLVFAAAGAVMAAWRKDVAVVLVFLAGVLAQAGALWWLSRTFGAGSSYMPFKMMYLAVPVAAVLGCHALSRAADWIAIRMPRVRWTAACVPVVVAGLLLPGRIPIARQHGSITESALVAGLWARDHVPTACVDYFSSYWLTGYWLHLDVLGNPRLSDRMRAESFDFPDSVGKWIEGRGLPWAFVEDFDAIPRDARVEMEPVYRSGRAAIVRNRRPAPCTDASRPIWTVR